MRRRKNNKPEIGTVREFKTQEKYIQITTKRGLTIWTNGGIGFSQEEVEKVLKKLQVDDRVLTVEVIDRRGK